ncbi:hypothetical protein G3I51_24190 [Streptomyces sp. SID9944]|nr:hypothetical protein [Streptomyces sp. SID9944]
MTPDLPEWLRTQLDTDEQIARAATPGPWEQSGIGEYGWGVSFGRAGAGVEAEDSDQGRADADHIATHDPARVLREIDAKRHLLDEHQDVNDGSCGTCVDGQWGYPTHGGSSPQRFPCRTLRLLALSYADRPGYRDEWRP